MNTLALKRVALLSLSIMVVAFISSCSNSSTPAPTKTDVLTAPANGWRIDRTNPSFSALGIDAATSAIFNSLRYKFNTNGTMALTATALGQTVTFQGSWRFTDNETKIVYNLNDAALAALNGSYDVLELTSSTYRIRQTISGQSLEWILVPAN